MATRSGVVFVAFALAVGACRTSPLNTKDAGGREVPGDTGAGGAPPAGFGGGGGAAGGGGGGAGGPGGRGGAGGTQADGPCVGLACQQSTCTRGNCMVPPCANGGRTTVSGSITDPAGKVPLF